MIRHICGYAALAVALCGIGRGWAYQEESGAVVPRATVNTTAEFSARESAVFTWHGDTLQTTTKAAWKISAVLKTPGLNVAVVSPNAGISVFIGKLKFVGFLYRDPDFKKGDLHAAFVLLLKDSTTEGLDNTRPVKCQLHFFLAGEIGIKLSGDFIWDDEKSLNSEGTTLQSRNYLNSKASKMEDIATAVRLSFATSDDTNYVAQFTANSHVNVVSKEVKSRSGLSGRYNNRIRIDTKTDGAKMRLDF